MRRLTGGFKSHFDFAFFGITRRVIISWGKNDPISWGKNDPSVIISWGKNDPSVIISWGRIDPNGNIYEAWILDLKAR